MIEVSGLTFRYGRTDVLDDIRLDVGPGVLGILGPNGAGKTTLLHLLATVTQPNTGTVRLLGLRAEDRRDRQRIRKQLGFLPQQLDLLPDFTTAEFVEYLGLMRGMSTRTINPAVARALDYVGLSDRAGTKMRTLSGGQRRRAGIAQALVNDPKLLLLDEPTVGLDPAQRVAFRDLLRRQGQASTVVVSTHLVDDVSAACSQVIVMKAGRIVFSGSPDDLANQAATDAIGDSPIELGYHTLIGGGWLDA